MFRSKKNSWAIHFVNLQSLIGVEAPERNSHASSASYNMPSLQSHGEARNYALMSDWIRLQKDEHIHSTNWSIIINIKYRRFHDVLCDGDGE
jgi:hypothetical protein